MENMNMATTESTMTAANLQAALTMLAPHLTVQNGKVCVVIPMTELAAVAAQRPVVKLPETASSPAPEVVATAETLRQHSARERTARATVNDTPAPKQTRKFLRAVVVSKLRKNANLNKLPLTPRAKVVLMAIHKRGEKGLTEKVAKKTAPKTKARHFDHGPWSSTVDWLVKHGLVEKREADPRWLDREETPLHAMAS